MFNIQITFYRKKVTPSNIWQRVATVESVVFFSIFFYLFAFLRAALFALSPSDTALVLALYNGQWG